MDKSHLRRVPIYDSSSFVGTLTHNSSADFVNGAYTASVAVAEAGSKVWHGGKVDTVVLMCDVKDGVVVMAGEKLGPVSGVAHLYANITIDAARGDETALLMQATCGQL